MKKVLLIDNYDSFTFNLAQMLHESNLCEYTIIKNDKVNLNKISEYNKILISPGPGLPEHTVNLFEIIDRFHEEKSILGICLGMQAIAEYFGADLYNLDKVYHGVKTNTKIIGKEDELFKDLPERIETGLYHSWAVSVDDVDELKVTAISQRNIIMAVSHIKYDVKGIQFHPESIMTKNGKKIIKNWLSY